MVYLLSLLLYIYSKNRYSAPKSDTLKCNDFSHNSDLALQNAICISLKNVLTLYYGKGGLAQTGKTSFLTT